MLEITRELVEHYLRATGWTLDTNEGTPWWLGKDWNGNTQRGFPASWLNAPTLDIDVVVRITGHGKHLASLAFRLGLCAAAESILLWASEWQLEKEEYRPGDAMDERCIRLLRESAERQLQNAGISAAAWESARKR